MFIHSLSQELSFQREPTQGYLFDYSWHWLKKYQVFLMPREPLEPKMENKLEINHSGKKQGWAVLREWSDLGEWLCGIMGQGGCNTGTRGPYSIEKEKTFKISLWV